MRMHCKQAMLYTWDRNTYEACVGVASRAEVRLMFRACSRTLVLASNMEVLEATVDF